MIRSAYGMTQRQGAQSLTISPEEAQSLTIGPTAESYKTWIRTEIWAHTFSGARQFTCYTHTGI